MKIIREGFGDGENDYKCDIQLFVTLQLLYSYCMFIILKKKKKNIAWMSAIHIWHQQKTLGTVLLVVALHTQKK